MALDLFGNYPAINHNHLKAFKRDLTFPLFDLRVGVLDNGSRMINFDMDVLAKSESPAKYYIEYISPFIYRSGKGTYSKAPSELRVVKIRNKSYTAFSSYGNDAEDMLTMLEDKFGVPLRD